MYKLWIQDNNTDCWNLADLGDDMPAMNYQANDIAELKNRQADYSQAVKLPISKNNAKIFGFANDFDVLTDVPYQRHNCRLECNDYTLAGKGSFLILDRITQYFECQILSGNADLFTALKDTDMSELDLGYYDWLVNAVNVSDFYVFGAATFKKGGSSELELSIRHSYPFIYIEPVIKKMLLSHGYTLEHNIGSLSTKATSLASLNSSEDSFENFGAKCSANAWRTNSVGNRFFDFNIVSDLTNSVRIVHEMSENGFIFKPNFSGTAKFRTIIRSNVTSTFLCIATARNKTPGSSYSQVITTNSNAWEEKIYESQDIKFIEGDEILYEGYGSDTTINNFTATVEIFDIKSDSLSVPYGGRVHIANNLGFAKQLDYFKMFAQCFGLTIKVDNSNMIVYAYTMDELYYNKDKAKNWSRKLNDDKNGIKTFTVRNYAQLNTIAFNDNTDDEVVDIGNFFINNTTLEASKELFKIELEAGKNNPVHCTYFDRYGGSEGSGALITGYLDIANIPLEDSDGIFQGSKPHLVDISTTIFVDYPDVEGLPSYRAVFTVKAQSLIDYYYDKITNEMLKNAIVTEENFYLTDQDIEEFDQFVPIYVDYFGGFFYVNKIKNYISGRLTKCELIKL